MVGDGQPRADSASDSRIWSCTLICTGVIRINFARWQRKKIIATGMTLAALMSLNSPGVSAGRRGRRESRRSRW